MRLKDGDRVVVHYVYPGVGGTIVPWMEARILIHTPSGCGDLWQVKDDNGVVTAINPYHWGFVGIFRDHETITPLEE